MALKQRAEQITHAETLGWEEEEEGRPSSDDHQSRKEPKSTSHRVPSLPFLPDDFLGATSLSRLSVAAHLDSSSNKPGTSLAGAGAPAPSAADECDLTLSVSSESVSLPTQVEVQPQAPAAAPAGKLTEASLEEGAADQSPKEQQQQQQEEEKKSQPPVVLPVAAQAQVAVDSALGRPPLPAAKTEATKEEGPQDLRVFELNSDSGKSTPSNNGKKGTQSRSAVCTAAGSCAAGFS